MEPSHFFCYYRTCIYFRVGKYFYTLEYMFILDLVNQFTLD